MQTIIIYGHGNESYVEEDELQPKMKAVCFHLQVHFNTLGVTWKQASPMCAAGWQEERHGEHLKRRQKSKIKWRKWFQGMG